MTREDLIRKVKVKIDEVSPFERDESNVIALKTPAESDIKPVYEYIEQVMKDACNEALMLIPLYRIKPKQFHNTDVHITGGVEYYNGFIKLPNDFLRLHSFKLQDWEREVSVAISTQNPMYKLQCNEFTKGKPYKPVCVLDERVGVGMTLEFFSTADRTPLVQKALYVPQFDDTDIQDSIADYFTIMTAARVFGCFGDEQREKMLLKEFDTKLKSDTL